MILVIFHLVGRLFLVGGMVVVGLLLLSLLEGESGKRLWPAGTERRKSG